jgi:hypothetical protein
MSRRICRQVLDCGDGVREVTALLVAAPKIAKRALTKSGDCEDSVAAVQDACAPIRAHAVYGLHARHKDRGGSPYACPS